MRILKNQRGALGAVEIALIVVLLAAGGFVAWRINQADKTVNQTAVDATTASDSPAAAPKATEKQENESGSIFVIKQLGIEMKLSAGLSGLSYVVKNGSDGQKLAYVSSKQLADKDPACKTEDNLAVIQRTSGKLKESADPTSSPGENTKQFDDFYVGFTGSKAACSEDEDIQKHQQDLIAKLRESFKNVKEIED